MHRTSLMLPRDLKARAERASRHLGMSLGELIRVSLEEELAKHESAETDALFADRVVYRGAAPPTLARDHDAWLYGSRR